MKPFKLGSSDEILVNEGNIDENVLNKLIVEAYKVPSLLAENSILYKKKEGCFFDYCYATYREIWDCYRNLCGKEDFHPYDKMIPNSLVKEALVNYYENKKTIESWEAREIMQGLGGFIQYKNYAKVLQAISTKIFK